MILYVLSFRLSKHLLQQLLDNRKDNSCSGYAVSLARKLIIQILKETKKDTQALQVMKKWARWSTTKCLWLNYLRKFQCDFRDHFGKRKSKNYSCLCRFSFNNARYSEPSWWFFTHEYKIECGMSFWSVKAKNTVALRFRLDIITHNIVNKTMFDNVCVGHTHV